MKKVFLFLALSMATMTTITSCSKDREEVSVKKDDFTNSDYIKRIMVGKWVGVASSQDGTSWHNYTDLPGTTPYTTYYKFENNNKYLFKPYTAKNDTSFNEEGDYAITPATSENNAILKLTHTYQGEAHSNELILLDYKDGVVTFLETNILSPTGKFYYKYRKEN